MEHYSLFSVDSTAQSKHPRPRPTPLAGGAGSVPPSPALRLQAPELPEDWRAIEVRYHARRLAVLLNEYLREGGVL